MGFWSTLGKIGKIAGPIAASFIPGVGPLASTGMKALTTAGKVAGGLAGSLGGSGGGTNPASTIGDYAGSLEAGRQKGREKDTEMGQAQDRNALNLYGAQNQANASQNNFAINRANLGNDQAGIDLKQRQFALDAPGTRAKQAMRGDYMANAQDASFTPLAGAHNFNLKSGFSPSMFSDSTRQLGRDLSSNALAANQQGDTFAPMTALPDYHAGAAAPGLTPIPQAGKTDSILSTTALIGSGIGSFADTLKNYQLKKPGAVAPAVLPGGATANLSPEELAAMYAGELPADPTKKKPEDDWLAQLPGYNSGSPV
jgi:hypothetical protein